MIFSSHVIWHKHAGMDSIGNRSIGITKGYIMKRVNFPDVLLDKKFYKAEFKTSPAEALAGWISQTLGHPIKAKALVLDSKGKEVMKKAGKDLADPYVRRTTVVDNEKLDTKWIKIFGNYNNKFVIYNMKSLDKFVNWGSPGQEHHKAYFSAFLITLMISGQRILFNAIEGNVEANIDEVRMYRQALNKFSRLKGPIKGVKQSKSKEGRRKNDEDEGLAREFSGATIFRIDNDLGKIYENFVQSHPDFKIEDPKGFCDGITKVYKFRGVK